MRDADLPLDAHLSVDLVLLEDLRGENLLEVAHLSRGAVTNLDEDFCLEMASFSAADSHVAKEFITEPDFLDEDLLLDADLPFRAYVLLDEDLLDLDLLVDIERLERFAEGDLLVADLV